MKNKKNNKLHDIGVYMIYNKVTGRYYFGSTITSFKDRIYSHKYELARNNHGNYKMQLDYNAYGANSFIYAIIFVSSNKSAIRAKEQELLDKFYGRKNCYNLQRLVDTRGDPGKTYDIAKEQNNYLVSPDGTLYESITNLRGFCRDRDLPTAEMYSLILGTVGGNMHSCKRWTLLYRRDTLKPEGRPPIWDKYINQVQELRKSGKSYRKIGKQLGISYTTVMKVLNSVSS